jgi:hypothetical protein
MKYEFFTETSGQHKASTCVVEVATSLGRIYQHTKERSIGAMTAFRGEYSLKENRERNEELKKKIREAGFGYVKVKGSYVENKGTEKENLVSEESFIVVGGKDKASAAKLKKFLEGAGKEYMQDSILFKPHDSEDASLVFTAGKDAGTTYNVGKWHPTNATEFFSQLKKGKSFEFKKPAPKKFKKTNKNANIADWWKKLSIEERKEYVKHHKHGKYANKIYTV